MARRDPKTVNTEPVAAETPPIPQPEPQPEPVTPPPRPTPKPAPPATGMAKVKVEMQLPPERFALLAADQPEQEDDTDDNDEFDEAVLAQALAASQASEPDARAEYIQTARRENELRAHVYRMPDRLQLYAVPDKLPKNRTGWIHHGVINFNPETYEEEIQGNFPPGNYWLDVRNRGQFVSKEIVSVAANPLLHQERVAAALPPVAPVTALPDAPPPEKQLKAMLDVAKQLISLQPAQAPQPPAPTLREQLAELRELQKLFAPQAAAPAHNPLEDLVKVVQSEAFKSIKEMMRSPDAEPKTTWMDVLRDALPYFAPALAPLVAVTSQLAAKQVARAYAANAQPSTQQPASRKPANDVPPAPIAGEAPRVITPAPPPPPAGTEDAEWEEEELNPLQQLVQDLSEQRPVTESAQTIRTALQRAPLVRSQVKRLIESDNATVWSMLALMGVPVEALAAVTWKDDWLNELRAELQTSPL